MMTRRTVHAAALAALASQALPSHAHAATGWRMPDEGEAHLRTWMAFAGSASIWGELLGPVQRDLARLGEAELVVAVDVDVGHVGISSRQCVGSLRFRNQAPCGARKAARQQSA